MANYAVAGSSTYRVALEHTPGDLSRPSEDFPPSAEREHPHRGQHCPGLAVPGWQVDVSTATKEGDQSLEGPIEMDIFHDLLPSPFVVCRLVGRKKMSDFGIGKQRHA